MWDLMALNGRSEHHDPAIWISREGAGGNDDSQGVGCKRRTFNYHSFHHCIT